MRDFLAEKEKKMDRQINPSRTDLDLLNRLKPLSFLSPIALRDLASGLNSTDFRRREVMVPEEALVAGVHVLLKGVAKITCLNRCGRRVIAAFLAPGPLPEFFSLPVSRWHFRCEAHTDCRIGSVSREEFEVISKIAPRSALERFHANDLMQWYRFFESSFSLLLGLDLRARLLSTLLQLCANFGVMESRGTLLRVSLSHKDLADLVGASRPRVTEHLAELEREHLLIRQGRQFIVCLDEIANSASVPVPAASASFAKAEAQPHSLKQLYSPRLSAAAASVKPLTRASSFSPVARPLDNSSAMA
ncbi:MAG: Crp/Fnr family transcriptional regulator [Candidatus Binataceae bacterium]